MKTVNNLVLIAGVMLTLSCTTTIMSYGPCSLQENASHEGLRYYLTEDRLVVAMTRTNLQSDKKSLYTVNVHTTNMIDTRQYFLLQLDRGCWSSDRFNIVRRYDGAIQSFSSSIQDGKGQVFNNLVGIAGQILGAGRGVKSVVKTTAAQVTNYYEVFSLTEIPGVDWMRSMTNFNRMAIANSLSKSAFVKVGEMFTKTGVLIVADSVYQMSNALPLTNKKALDVEGLYYRDCVPMIVGIYDFQPLLESSNQGNLVRRSSGLFNVMHPRAGWGYVKLQAEDFSTTQAKLVFEKNGMLTSLHFTNNSSADAVSSLLVNALPIALSNYANIIRTIKEIESLKSKN